MSFEVKTLPLSSLSPLRMTYNYNSTEELTSRYRVIDSGLRYYEHDLLTNCTDGAFSQQNAIILTKRRTLKPFLISKQLMSTLKILLVVFICQ